MGYFRRKSGVIKGKKTYTKYKRVKYVKGIRQPNNRMGQYGRAPTLSKVISLINNTVSKKLSAAQENKMSANNNFADNIATWQHGTNLRWFFHGFDALFNTSPGTSVAQRIGNKFKLKKWIIRGFIHPSDDFMKLWVNPQEERMGWFNHLKYLPNTYQGCVTVYLGKKIDGSRLTNNLPDLLNNGAANHTPSGNHYESLYRVNDDQYKIYWKRRFKMGMSEIPDRAISYGVPPYETRSNPQFGTTMTEPQGPMAKYQNIQMLPNNDYKLTGHFNINVTDYIGKNATIKFNDNNSAAVLPSAMSGLCMFATWSPFLGDMTQHPEAEVTGQEFTSFFKVVATTHFEYEDS